MNLFASASLLLAIVCFVLVVILIAYGKTKLHKIWMMFNVSVGLWALGALIINYIKDPTVALLTWRIVEVSVVFIAVYFFHITLIVCNQKSNKLLYFAYVQGVIFSLFSLFSPLFFSKVNYVFDSFYYPPATPLFYAFFSIWMSFVGYSQFILFTTIFKSKGKHQNQLLYFGLATLVGFTGGATNFFPHFGLNLYPFGNLTILLYCMIVTYATLRFRLLDIKTAITRFGIFVAIYSLVLGFPFLLAVISKQFLVSVSGNYWYMFPLLSSTFLSIIGPRLHLYFQEKADQRLLDEQHRYQSTLQQASMGMGRIKDLERLIKLIIHILIRTVRIKNCNIFLLDKTTMRFTLKGSNDSQFFKQGFILNQKLINYLEKNKEPILIDDLLEEAKDESNKLTDIIQTIEDINAEIIIPSFIEQKLIAIIALGQKKSKALYSEDDLVVFSILANQAGLAIENAMFYEDMKRKHEQLFKAEKMATIGTMADGLSHQINNRLHAMGFIAGDTIDTINIERKSGFDEEEEKVVKDLEYAFDRIQKNVVQGGEVVEGLLRYTRKGDEGFEPVDLKELIDASFEMASYKIKARNIEFVNNVDGQVSKLKGNFTQLQEVFFNIFDNAYDAMMQRKLELKEEGFRPRLEVAAKDLNGQVQITIQDNGMGVRKEDIVKLFTPFFTTKISSKKGTGLGLYVIKQIIEDNHDGKVEFSSVYKEGSRTRIVLPVYQKVRVNK